MLKGKIIEIIETDQHFFTYFLVADTFKYIIGKFDNKIMSIINSLHFATISENNQNSITVNLSDSVDLF